MSKLLQARDWLYVAPLYSIPGLRVHPCLHRVVIVALDLLALLILFVLLYGPSLVASWGILFRFALPQSVLEGFLIFVLTPIIPGVFFLIGFGVVIFLVVAGVCGLCALWGFVSQDESYIRPQQTVTC